MSDEKNDAHPYMRKSGMTRLKRWLSSGLNILSIRSGTAQHLSGLQCLNMKSREEYGNLPKRNVGWILQGVVEVIVKNICFL